VHEDDAEDAPGQDESGIPKPESRIPSPEFPNPESRPLHVPVLVRETLEFLNVRPDGTYIDATLGGGGHSLEILQRLESGRLLSLDRDPRALEVAGSRLAGFGEKLMMQHGNFAQIDALHAASGLPPVDGVIADLGLSSIQLDDASRGFSFNLAGPLDMRMDTGAELTAADLVNHADERELADIFFKLGEERHSRRIARAIVKARPYRFTTELAQVVTRAIPSRAGLHQIHPATRSFMALRLAVNGELENLEQFLDRVLTVLRPSGRVVILSFHSLEDRPVKQAFRRWQDEGLATVLTRKVIRPTEDEVQINPRARSAKLRAAEKQGVGSRE
jgi:16S rRNA (cytosine1402-N4)-methyltransferase